jgi:hypothetical protein
MIYYCRPWSSGLNLSIFFLVTRLSECWLLASIFLQLCLLNSKYSENCQTSSKHQLCKMWLEHAYSLLSCSWLIMCVLSPSSLLLLIEPCHKMQTLLLAHLSIPKNPNLPTQFNAMPLRLLPMQSQRPVTFIPHLRLLTMIPLKANELVENY